MSELAASPEQTVDISSPRGPRREALQAYAEATWDTVLVPLGKASAKDADRFSFLYFFVDDKFPSNQYRFQGCFGFGGKLIVGHQFKTSVSAYPEHRTPERDLLQADINSKLLALWQEHAPRLLPA